MDTVINPGTRKGRPNYSTDFKRRGRRGNVVKLLWSSGDGLCLFAKRLERGRFIWPQAEDGKVHLTQAQLSMMLEGIDWKQPKRSCPPQNP